MKSNLAARLTCFAIGLSLSLASFTGCRPTTPIAQPSAEPAGSDIATPSGESSVKEASADASLAATVDSTDAASAQQGIGERQQALAADAYLARLTGSLSSGWWSPVRLQRRGRSNDRRGVPEWDFDQAFASEAFRFVRVKYRSFGGYGPYGKWYTDYPDSDLNFSFRLQQLTTMNVHPEPLYLELTDPRIFDYPFMYMIEPGFISFSEPEVVAFREYFDRGGFVMVDDFWGEREWYNFYLQMKRVFPEREPVELPLEHPIFHLVYDLKQKPQVPSIHHWRRSGLTYERSDAKEVHYREFFDDDGRMVMMICHNTDLGDGWEREGESREYFETFSEKWAYPMGINIVVYAMTH